MKKSIVLLVSVLLAASSLHAQNKKVLYASRMGHDVFLRMQAAVPNVTLIEADQSKVAELLPTVDGVIGSIDPKLVLQAPNLKWLQIESAGAERYTFNPDFCATKVILTNCKIVQGPEIADHAMGMLLGLTRQLVRAIHEQSREEWPTQSYTPVELLGKTAVIVGVGGIGTQIALRAQASGMTVIGVDPKDFPYVPYLSRSVKPDQLDEVLPLADVVFISAPLTRASMGIMGAKEFALMKPNSYFIAVSRGRVYDMNALVKALETKRLAGAGLDVTNPEPLPKGHPLWKFSNVVITPHVAGKSDGEFPRDEALFTENLRRFGAGEPLLNVVDKEQGY